MAIEDALPWISFAISILGAIAFVWRFVEYWTGRKERSNKSLNENVLRPWSELLAKQDFGPNEVDGLTLLIPKATDASTWGGGQEGFRVSRLPGLTKGEAFLRKRYRSTFQLWVRVKVLTEEYQSTRRLRRSLIQSLVREGMPKLDPALKAVEWNDWAPNTYLFDHIVAQVEDAAYFTAKYSQPSRSLSITRTSSNEVISFEVSSNYILLKVPEERKDIADAFVKLLSSWTSDEQVRSASAKLVEAYGELEKAIEEFRSALKEVVVTVDMSGR